MGTSRVTAYAHDAFEKGLMGKEVTLTLKNLSATLTGPFAATTPKTYELKGQILRRPRGHERDFETFGFSMPFTHLPMRVVSIRHVLAVDGVPVLQKREDPKMRKFEARSSRGDSTYTVTEKNGHWSCTCVANASFRKTCRHITEMKDKHG